MASHRLVVGLIAIVTSGGCGSPGGALPSQPQEGIATWYEADGSGHCGFDPSPADMKVAAINAAQYFGSAACGQCATVDGPSGSVTVRIVDSCPDCEPGQLDLSQQAFERIAALHLGRVPVKWAA